MSDHGLQFHRDEIFYELQQAKNVLEDVMYDEIFIKEIRNAADIMINSLKKGGKIIACGNGGSMSDSMHFASELTGKYRENRKPIAAMAISDPSYLTCVGNDMGYEYSFSRSIVALAKPEDVVVLITTSGNSKNILTALKANAITKCKIIALTGNGGGSLSKGVGLGDGDSITGLFPDVEIRVPHTGYADRIQELHIKIIHILVMLIEKGLGY